MTKTNITAQAAQRVEASGNSVVDVDYLVGRFLLDGGGAMDLNQARGYAVHCMKKDDAIRSVHLVVLMCDDSVDLLRFGPRGGHRRITRLLNKKSEAI